MVTINVISYEDERLGFFVDQRRAAQKKYERLEKQLKLDSGYLSAEVEALSDCGRKLSFYNDVIEMLENDVVPRREVDKLQEAYTELNKALAKTIQSNADLVNYEKTKLTREIFEEIKNKISGDINDIVEHVNRIADPDAIDGQYEAIDTLEWVLDFVAELKNKYLSDNL